MEGRTEDTMKKSGEKLERKRRKNGRKGGENYGVVVKIQNQNGVVFLSSLKMQRKSL